MKQTIVSYEEGTGGMIRSVKILGQWRLVDGGIEFDHVDPKERRIPAPEVTTWVPMHRVINTETRDV